MNDEPPNEVYVLPGESHLVSEPTILRTVLGSCVGVTFRVPRLGIAALCHPMLPACPRGSTEELNIAVARRYVDFTIRDLVRQFDSRGARREEIEVKLFGGGDVLVVVNPSAARPTVGKLNRETAVRVLREEGLDVLASSLGGTCGLNIQFHTLTGEVLLKRLIVAGNPCGDEEWPGRQASGNGSHGRWQKKGGNLGSP
jgi:chemotaxis protein CheD